ncbi:hypothetical protein K469DRAFT_555250 [Zopfia rhizophila CBS 207.26]|uniref:Uncharacterized protein n=1 Tax=Zopfia rhizophila CBS 207.26 TaxID=1314779 RepID=A0A6A6ELL7_9PEZI|nr:hypothetical protein K469DRAFT_555250 [Zopfia rhizophila CBS 207.26]
MADSVCSSATCRLPLHDVLNWSPFRIDALGIITMIGVEQVDSAVGRLVRSRYAEYLPLLGAFVFASDQFADARSGYVLYNISAGITTTSMAGWFARWCIAQNFSRSDNMVRWSVDSTPKKVFPQRWDMVLASFIGVVSHGCIIALTVLQGDYWGLANAISMAISVLVRSHVIKQNRQALDAAAERAQNGGSVNNTEAKFLVILPDAKMITMYAPWDIVKTCFIDNPLPANPRLYYIIRMMGWAGFAVQAITLGMSGLATQIVTVFIMVISTLLTHFKAGCDDHIVGTRLRAQLQKLEMKRRQDVYVALQLEDYEEESMLQWNLMPHKTQSPMSKQWWDDYFTKKSSRNSSVVEKVSSAPVDSAMNSPV